MKTTYIVSIAFIIALLLIFCTLGCNHQKQDYYSITKISQILRDQGMTIRMLPHDKGPFSLGEKIWYNPGETIAGSYISKGKRINFKYPSDPDHATIICVLEKNNKERTHLLAILEDKKEEN